MKKDSISLTIRCVNQINLEHRKNPMVAHDASVEVIENFVASTGLSREDLLDKLQSRLEDSPEQTDLLIIVEMLKQYE